MIKNFSADVQDIQFPTVTICPKGWANDRWGFIKAYLNEYNLTNDIAVNYIANLWKFYVDKYYDVFQEALEHGIHKIDALVLGTNVTLLTEKDLLNFNYRSIRNAQQF